MMLTTAIDILSGHSIGALAATAGAVMLAGFLRGFVGFGGAVAIVLVMSAAYDPLIAIPVASLVGVPSTFQLLPSIIRDSDRKFVVGFSLAAVATAPLGGFVLVALDPASMKIILSVFVLVMVVPLYMEWRPPAGALAGLPGVLLTGVISGAIQGSASMGGPPAVVAALASAGPAQRTAGQRHGRHRDLEFLRGPAVLPAWALYPNRTRAVRGGGAAVHAGDPDRRALFHPHRAHLFPYHRITGFGLARGRHAGFSGD